MSYCKIDGINIYYEVVGEGTPVFMLHGFGVDHRIMSGCMEPIFDKIKGYKRIYFDLPGMGKTRCDNYEASSDQILKTVLGFVEELAPNQKFLLIGESYGGYLARGILRFKSPYVSGMLLICPCIIAEKTIRNLPQHVSVEVEPIMYEQEDLKESKIFKSMAVIQNQKIWERYKSEIVEGTKIADKDFLEILSGDKYSFSFDVDSLKRPFYKPVLIVTGRQDSWVGYRDAWSILENYPRGTFAVLDRAGHNLQIEQGQLFFAMVEEWLERVRKYSSTYIQED